MINTLIRKPGEPNRVLRLSHCPQCGQRGLYHITRQYSRCRYCGQYRIRLPGQDS